MKFMLETRVNEWKDRCNLHFQAKSSHFNSEIMSFHKRSLPILV